MTRRSDRRGTSLVCAALELIGGGEAPLLCRDRSANERYEATSP